MNRGVVYCVTTFCNTKQGRYSAKNRSNRTSGRCKHFRLCLPDIFILLYFELFLYLYKYSHKSIKINGHGDVSNEETNNYG